MSLHAIAGERSRDDDVRAYKNKHLIRFFDYQNLKVLSNNIIRIKHDSEISTGSQFSSQPRQVPTISMTNVNHGNK